MSVAQVCWSNAMDSIGIGLIRVVLLLQSFDVFELSLRNKARVGIDIHHISIDFSVHHAAARAMYLTRTIAHRSNTLRRLFSYSMATTMTTMMVSHNPTTAAANSATPFTTKAVEESPSTSWRTLQQMHELYQNGSIDRRMPSSSSTSSSTTPVKASDSSSSPSSSSPPLPRRHFDELSLPSSSRHEALRTMRGRSGVLIGLFTHPRTGQVHVLLTQRSQELRSHAGDVAFPSVDNNTHHTNTHTSTTEHTYIQIQRYLSHMNGFNSHVSVLCLPLHLTLLPSVVVRWIQPILRSSLVPYVRVTKRLASYVQQVMNNQGNSV